MNSRNKLTLVFSLQTALLLGVLFAENSAAQSVSRLFSTPAERAELERQRILQFRPDLRPAEVEQQSIVELPDFFELEEAEDVIYRHGGTMLRSDGLYTVWLNGESINQQDLPSNIELLRPFSQGTLRVSDAETGAEFEVKPGQVLNLSRGELFESYQFEEPASVSDEAADSVTESTAEADIVDAQNPDSV